MPEPHLACPVGQTGQTIVFCGLQVMSRGPMARGSRARNEKRASTRTTDFSLCRFCVTGFSRLQPVSRFFKSASRRVGRSHSGRSSPIHEPTGDLRWHASSERPRVPLLHREHDYGAPGAADGDGNGFVPARETGGYHCVDLVETYITPGASPLYKIDAVAPPIVTVGMNVVVVAPLAAAPSAGVGEIGPRPVQ